MRTARTIVLGVMAVLAASFALPSVSEAATPVTFGDDYEGIRLGSACVTGRAPSDRALHLVWKSAAGASKANVYIPTRYGYWSHCSANGDVLAAGDLLKATVGATTRRLVMPDVTIAVDRVRDVMRGRGPAGSVLELRYVYNYCCWDSDVRVDVTVDSDGRWMFDDDSSLDGFSANVEWTSTKGDHVGAASNAPDVVVDIGRPLVTGSANPGAAWKVVLRNTTTGTRKGVAQGTADEWGRFSGVFLNASGRPVNVMVGDRVVGSSLTADMDFIVRDIAAAADVATEIVTGKCGNGRMFYSAVRRAGIEIGGTWFAKDRKPDGSFTVDFSEEETLGYDPANIRHGDRLVVTCRTGRGDFVEKSILVP